MEEAASQDICYFLSPHLICEGSLFHLTELIGVDERRLDLPDQLSLLTVLWCRPARKKNFPTLSCTLLFCHVKET